MLSLWARMPLLYDLLSIKTEVVPAAYTPDSSVLLSEQGEVVQHDVEPSHSDDSVVKLL